ncbi:MAG: translation initiation factor IF-2 [Prevotellaceae bacterium]|jgi:translation initiation factor IF-2|nr:translation initiation factor IF-2 [Prevotellaceae bacterium]
MTENETIRINKVVKELNIGIGTLVEFFKKKGIDVDPSPNSKITTEAYLLAQKEFDKEHLLKEQSKKIIFKIVEPEVVTNIPIQEKQVLPHFETEVVTPQPHNEEFVEQPLPEPKPKPEPELAPKTTDLQELTPTLKVVGRIDLTPKPKKKKNDHKQNKTMPKGPPPQKPIQEAPAKEQKRESEAEEATHVTPVLIEHIETKVKKLSGPTITGNIDLSKFEKKKTTPEHTSDKQSKGKRERIQKGQRAKVDVAKVAAGKSRNQSGGGKGSKNKERFRPVRTEVDEDAVQKQIKETYARMIEGKGKTKGSKYRREKRDLASQRFQEEKELRALESNILEVTEFVTVNELASMMNIPAVKVIEACMNLGHIMSINQRLDAEAMVLVAEEFGFEVKFVSVEIQGAVEQEQDLVEDMSPRPPIVTVMGHVDHGKTSLLDYIRKANVIAGEAGGITQHIGAYNVLLPNDRQITFLDTPGHEAFTAMRARGAKVTDMAIIIVAADDAVMPQTVEAINHAVAAGVPMIFAINKIDKSGANPEKIREQLAAMNYLVEDWGGKYQCQEISAKQGLNVDKLLEKVLLEAEMLDLKANPDKHAVGTVIESSLDKGRGYLATLLVQSGTMRVGDAILSGVFSGRVKAMFNERGQKIDEAGPSTPVSILGLNGAPTAGEIFNVVADEREARELANKREQLQRIQNIRTQKHITLEEIGRRIAIGNFQQLNIIVKGDVDGSVEALSDSLIKLSTEEIQVAVIHKAVGGISESDVLLAVASNAIIIGFQVRPSATARKLAEKEEIEIRLYSVIYDAINEVKSGIEGMLAPEEKEEVTASVEIREIFKISKVGTIAGCMVKEGKITRNAKIRLVRDGIVIHTGTLGSLKRFKDDVKEVASGYDCGLNIDGFNDIKVGDMIEAYTIVEIKRKL